MHPRNGVRKLAARALIFGLAFGAACSTEPNRQFTVSVVPTPQEGGTATGGGSYTPGSTVTVTAVPATGFMFIAWKPANSAGNVVSTKPIYTFVDSADVALVAIFASILPPAIESPTAFQVAGDSVRVVVRHYSGALLRAVRASAGDAQTQLVFDDDFGSGAWVGILRLTGLPLDTLPIKIEMSESAGATTTRTVSIIHDAPPTISVAAPVNLSVARPRAPYAMSCTDDHPGCTVTIREFSGPTFASAAGSAAGFVSLADRDGRAVSLSFVATDSRGQQSTASRAVYVELSPSLDSLGATPQPVWDFTPTQILFGAQASATTQLAVKDIATGREEIVSPRAQTFRGILTSFGSLVSIRSSLPQYTTIVSANGQETTIDGRVIDVAEPYLLMQSSDSLYRFDLRTRIRDFVARVPGVLASDDTTRLTVAVASNGDVVMGGLSNSLRRYRNGAVEPLPREPSSGAIDSLPFTDGNIVVYVKVSESNDPKTYQIAMSDGFAETLLGNPRLARTSTQPSGFIVVPKRDYAVNAGWVAFTQLDAANVHQIWLRSPTGALRQITSASTSSFISALGPDGTIIFVTGARRHLCPPNGVPRDVGSSSFGKVVWKNGQPYLVLGVTVWRIR